MKRDSSFANCCSAMKTSSLAKNDDRGYSTASAMRRTSMGCFLEDQWSCPSATGVPLPMIKNAAVKTRNGTRNCCIPSAALELKESTCVLANLHFCATHPQHYIDFEGK